MIGRRQEKDSSFFGDSMEYAVPERRHLDQRYDHRGSLPMADFPDQSASISGFAMRAPSASMADLSASIPG